MLETRGRCLLYDGEVASRSVDDAFDYNKGSGRCARKEMELGKGGYDGSVGNTRGGEGVEGRAEKPQDEPVQ